jgi:hypothetical protein
VYPGAYHGFDVRLLQPEVRYLVHWLEYNEPAAKDAEERVRAFLAAHGGGTSPGEPDRKVRLLSADLYAIIETVRRGKQTLESIIRNRDRGSKCRWPGTPLHPRSSRCRQRVAAMRDPPAIQLRVFPRTCITHQFDPTPTLPPRRRGVPGPRHLFGSMSLGTENGEINGGRRQ